jgi:hypothetical protein
VGQRLEDDGDECDPVSGPKQSGEHRKNLGRHRDRNDIAVANRRSGRKALARIYFCGLTEFGE